MKPHRSSPLAPHPTVAWIGASLSVPILIAAAIIPIAAISTSPASGQMTMTTADALIGTSTVRITATSGVSVGVIVGSTSGGPIAFGDERFSDGEGYEHLLRSLDGSIHRLQAGEQLTITLDGIPNTVGTAPMASGRVIPSDDTVVGTVDGAGSFLVRAWRPDGSSAVRSFELAEPGVFSVDLSDDLDLRPETPVEVIAPISEFAFRTLARAESVTATLGADRLSGFAPPGATVAGTVRDEGGRSVADASGQANGLGQFDLRLEGRDGGQVRLRAGDDLLVAWLGRAEPLAFIVPELTADVDPERDQISGRGLASWHVEVGVRRSGGTSSWRIPTGPFGDYALAVPGGLNQGDSGSVAMELSERATVARPWVVPDIVVELESAEVAGAGIDGQRIEAELMRRGVLVGRAELSVPASSGMTIAGCPRCDWRIQLSDASGYPAPISPGDTLRVGVDSGWTDVVVPHLSFDVNPETEEVFGTTEPGRTLNLRLGAIDSPIDEVSLSSASDGTFMGRFPEAELVVGDWVWAEVRLGGVTFRASEEAWTLSVDIGRGEVSGHARPGERVLVALDRDDELVGYIEGFAGSHGEFKLILLARDGSTLTIRPGDRIRIEAAGRSHSVLVPEITLRADRLDDVVFGEAPADGALNVRAIDERGLDGGVIEVDALRAESDTYAVDLAARFDVSGGDRLLARYRSEAGEVFERALRVPLIMAQLGGNTVVGVAEPGVDVLVTALRGGETIARRTTRAGADGVFSLGLVDGSDVRLSAGDLVSTEWDAVSEGASGAESTSVVDISAQIEVPIRAVSGVAPSNSRIVATVDEASVGSWPPIGSRSASDGRFSVEIPGLGRLLAGSIADVSTDDPLGHRTWIRSVLARLEIEIGRQVVRGLADPLADYELTLKDGAESIAAGTVRTRTSGQFEAALTGERPVEAVMLPGQELVLRPRDGSEAEVTASLIIPALSIEIDGAGRLVHGVAPPSASLRVFLSAVGRPTSHLDVSVGAGGAWSVLERDFPSGVEVGDLREVEARFITVEGHQISASATPRSIPTALPSAVVPTATPAATESATAVATAVATAASPTSVSPSPTPRETDDPTPSGPIFLPWTIAGAFDSDG